MLATSNYRSPEPIVMINEQFMIPAEHPCLLGHFPGQPLIPAVVILDEVLAAVRQRYQRRVAILVRSKFIHSLKPDAVCEITLEDRGEDFVRFRCTAKGTLLAHGQFKLVSNE